MESVRLLISTILFRPYVFIFLAAYLVLAIPSWGWRRTILYSLLGYCLAWAAEYSSSHGVFPFFGPYRYIMEPTRDKELWVAGVPFMDSLSFVFLTFAGLQMARLAREPLVRSQVRHWDVRWAFPDRSIGWKTWALAGLLTMGLDVVIDPLALRGERWFLGQIYEYSHNGIYFGVPLSNFAGWALLAWAIIGAFCLLERFLLSRHLGAWRGFIADALLGGMLFTGILAFNLWMTFVIGEILLGLLGFAWSACMLAPVLRRIYAKIPAVSPG
jgi:uncharacterized membrane protein